ncbi:unnamed protein product [Medioppia subpectinata]|uniref:Replication stress response regulator SDE2 n=1 Tax=Medioppia subpectinata TaxID=1979941 RepID=A0A7R9KZF5_9ACAR|nr:unnamed protein product [Medioppia subpectinata]CAG2111557.1 unnamed protein product [Medioppia subpectinata]
MSSANIFYKSPLNGFKTRCVQLDGHEKSGRELSQRISLLEAIPENDFKLYSNDKPLSASDVLTDGSVVWLSMGGLRGGKGGFGSMLRAIGAQIEKTTNREACRDLTGRRLRDINEEKRIKEWIKKEALRKKEMDERRIQKLKKRAEKPKAEFNDIDFERQRAEIPDIVDEALQYGLQLRQKQSTCSSAAGSSGEQSVAQKRKSDHKLAATKKKKKLSLWMGVDGIDVEDSDEEPESDGPVVYGDSSKPSTVTSSSAASSAAEVEESSELSSGSDEAKQSVVECSTDLNQLNDDKSDDKPNTDEKVSSEVVSETEQRVVNDSNEPKAPKEPEVVYEPLDLMAYESVDQLEALGLDRLKYSLTALGLKCGGSLAERANRLFSVRGLQTKDIPKKLFAVNKKK